MMFVWWLRGATGSGQSTKTLDAAFKGAQISLFKLAKVMAITSGSAEFVANITIGAVSAVHLFLLNIYLNKTSATAP